MFSLFSFKNKFHCFVVVAFFFHSLVCDDEISNRYHHSKAQYSNHIQSYRAYQKDHVDHSEKDDQAHFGVDIHNSSLQKMRLCVADMITDFKKRKVTSDVSQKLETMHDRLKLSMKKIFRKIRACDEDLDEEELMFLTALIAEEQSAVKKRTEKNEQKRGTKSAFFGIGEGLVVAGAWLSGGAAAGGAAAGGGAVIGGAAATGGTVAAVGGAAAAAGGVGVGTLVGSGAALGTTGCIAATSTTMAAGGAAAVGTGTVAVAAGGAASSAGMLATVTGWFATTGAAAAGTVATTTLTTAELTAITGGALTAVGGVVGGVVTLGQSAVELVSGSENEEIQQSSKSSQMQIVDRQSVHKSNHGYTYTPSPYAKLSGKKTSIIVSPEENSKLTRESIVDRIDKPVRPKSVELLFPPLAPAQKKEVVKEQEKEETTECVSLKQKLAIALIAGGRPDLVITLDRDIICEEDLIRNQKNNKDDGKLHGNAMKSVMYVTSDIILSGLSNIAGGIIPGVKECSGWRCELNFAQSILQLQKDIHDMHQHKNLLAAVAISKEEKSLKAQRDFRDIICRMEQLGPLKFADIFTDIVGVAIRDGYCKDHRLLTLIDAYDNNRHFVIPSNLKDVPYEITKMDLEKLIAQYNKAKGDEKSIQQYQDRLAKHQKELDRCKHKHDQIAKKLEKKDIPSRHDTLPKDFDVARNDQGQAIRNEQGDYFNTKGEVCSWNDTTKKWEVTTLNGSKQICSPSVSTMDAQTSEYLPTFEAKKEKKKEPAKDKNGNDRNKKSQDPKKPEDTKSDDLDKVTDRKDLLPKEGKNIFEPKKQKNGEFLRDRKGGYIDKHGNSWNWDPKKGEWDVVGKHGHRNVSPQGRQTHSGTDPKSSSDTSRSKR